MYGCTSLDQHTRATKVLISKAARAEGNPYKSKDGKPQLQIEQAKAKLSTATRAATRTIAEANISLAPPLPSPPLTTHKPN